MRIAVEHIRNGASTLELKCESKDIGLEVEGISFIDPIIAKLEIFKQGDKVFVKANLSVDIKLECAKCLSPIRRTLEGTLENQYLPMPKTPIDLMDDIGIGYYSGDYIELSEDFRESFLLELPAKSLCSEDCKGLCSHCGQDLNTGQCDCYSEPEEEIRNSRFADLIKKLEVNRKLEV